jgi:hypothetical protein
MVFSEDTARQEDDLGAIQATFGSSRTSRALRASLGTLCILLGVLFCLACVAGFCMGRAEAVHGAVFGVAFLTGGSALLMGNRLAAKTSVEVCAKGLVVREGAMVTSCTWGEIIAVIEKQAVSSDDVLAELRRHESRAIQLVLHSGLVIILKSYVCRLAELGAIIKRETLPLLLPSYQSALHSGQPVKLGLILLDRDGIVVGMDRLPWCEVSGADRKGGWVRLHRIGSWKSWKKVKLSEVPDAHVLIEMVNQRAFFR